MTPEQKDRLEAKVVEWNKQSLAKPGSRVRVYTLLSDGGLGVEDKLRSEIEQV